jgi:hypothetical protein
MKTRWLRTNKKRRCPICGAPDWCGISEDGTAAICMRTPSEKKVAKSGWLHRLDNGATAKPIARLPKLNLKVNTTIEPATPLCRQNVYSLLIEKLVLSHLHRDLLNQRGLDDITINVNGYRSMPSQLWANQLAQSFARDSVRLGGVPGFFKSSDSNWKFATYNATGYLIPIRDCHWRTVALTLRRDTPEKPKYLLVSSASKPGGASSGAPAHFALWKSFSRESVASIEEITITEGALKADCIAALLNQPAVGLVGVSCFDESLPVDLCRAFPSLRKVKIAFDMDRFSNAQVQEQLNRLVQVLSKAEIETRVLRWDRRFKGYDDFLSAAAAQERTLAA